ncbi:MAG: HPF/RaiA family ribosome-associated protein [Candidatus Portnoybacteria bacterium]|nr:HPF/RaiA family ribosome-associated protein [Candidatus Portnoybacteria bacterium]
MNFIIKSREVNISSDFNSYIQKRISKLEKFLEDIDPALIEATIEIEKEIS